MNAIVLLATAAAKASLILSVDCSSTLLFNQYVYKSMS
jgi:hypothetical protein